MTWFSALKVREDRVYVSSPQCRRRAATDVPKVVLESLKRDVQGNACPGYSRDAKRVEHLKHAGRADEFNGTTRWTRVLRTKPAEERVKIGIRGSAVEARRSQRASSWLTDLVLIYDIERKPIPIQCVNVRLFSPRVC